MAQQFKLSDSQTLTTPDPKEDWDDKTASNWSSHASFLERSKESHFATPPRLAAAMIEAQVPQPLVSREKVRLIVMVVMLVVCGAAGVKFADGSLTLETFTGGAETVTAASEPNLKPIAKRKQPAAAPAPNPESAVREPASEAPAPAAPTTAPAPLTQ